MLCGAGRSQQMAPMNQSTHTLMAFSSHTVGWVIHRKSLISFCTSRDFPLHNVNSLSVYKPSLPSLSRSHDALLHSHQVQEEIRKKQNSDFYFHNFNLKFHSISVFTPVYRSNVAVWECQLQTLPFNLAKHTPKVWPQKTNNNKKINLQVATQVKKTECINKKLKFF